MIRGLYNCLPIRAYLLCYIQARQHLTDNVMKSMAFISVILTTPAPPTTLSASTASAASTAQVTPVETTLGGQVTPQLTPTTPADQQTTPQDKQTTQKTYTTTEPGWSVLIAWLIISNCSICL